MTKGTHRIFERQEVFQPHEDRVEMGRENLPLLTVMSHDTLLNQFGPSFWWGLLTMHCQLSSIRASNLTIPSSTVWPQATHISTSDWVLHYSSVKYAAIIFDQPVYLKRTDNMRNGNRQSHWVLIRTYYMDSAKLIPFLLVANIFSGSFFLLLMLPLPITKLPTILIPYFVSSQMNNWRAVKEEEKGKWYKI